MKLSNSIKQILTVAAIIVIAIFGQSCSKNVDQPGNAGLTNKTTTGNTAEVIKPATGSTNSFTYYPLQQTMMPNLTVAGVASQSTCSNIFFRVYNKGGAASGAFYVGVRNNFTGTWDAMFVDNISANSYMDLRYSGPNRTGNYTVMADFNNYVTEINETDNSANIQMGCIY